MNYLCFIKASDASCVMTDCFGDFAMGNFEYSVSLVL